MRGVLRSLAICMLCLYIHAVDQSEPAAPEMVIAPPEEATTRPSSCSDRPLLLNVTDNFSKQQRTPDMDIVMEEPSQKAELIERVSPRDVVKEVLIPQANASYEKLSSGPPWNKIEEQSWRSVSEACWVDRWSISQKQRWLQEMGFRKSTRHLKMDQDLNLVNITKEELFSLGGNDMVWETIMNLRALCDVPDIRSWDKSQVALWLKVQDVEENIFKTFLDNGINGGSLFVLGSPELKCMNVTTLYKRIHLLRMITNLRATESAAEKVESLINLGQRQQGSAAEWNLPGWELFKGQPITSGTGEIIRLYIILACWYAAKIILGFICLAYFFTSVQTWFWKDENVSVEAKNADRVSVDALSLELFLGGLVSLEACFQLITSLLSSFVGSWTSWATVTISLLCLEFGIVICTHSWNDEVLKSLTKYLQHETVDFKNLPIHFCFISLLPTIWLAYRWISG